MGVNWSHSRLVRSDCMEMARITKEQAEALDKLFEKTTWTKDEVLERHALDTPWRQREYSPLNKLTLPEMAKALYVGYKVKDEN